jgi:hypothetical protein
VVQLTVEKGKEFIPRGGIGLIRALEQICEGHGGNVDYLLSP